MSYLDQQPVSNNFWALDNIDPNQFNQVQPNNNLFANQYSHQALNSAPNVPQQGNWWGNQLSDGGMLTREGMFGGQSGGGWLSGLANIGSNLVQGYTGLQQLKLGKDALDLNKKVTTTNLNNQAQLTNISLNQRYANAYSQASPSERESMLTPEQYAEKNNVKGI